MKVFIDSNIPMYVAGRAHPNRPAALRLLERVRAGELQGCTSTEVLQEILYRYCSLQRRDLARRVYDLFVHICTEVFAVELSDTDLACELLQSPVQISARDAVHAAVMRNRGVEWIATFDADFDRISGLRRLPLDQG